MVYHDDGICNWEDVPELAYKEDGTHFKKITRRTLFEGNEYLSGELRYFEIAPGGYSTLERHEHLHVVMILRGHGSALVGNTIHILSLHDVVTIDPWVWHQFRATDNVTFGFLCLVNSVRDRPSRPDAEALAKLCSNQRIADFIKT